MGNTTDKLAEITKEGYKDLVQPAAKVVGDTLGKTTKMLLAPIRALTWGWEKVEAVIGTGLENRLKSRKKKDLHSPNPHIAVPLVQSLCYAAEEEAVREMFLNLLANSMDKNYDNLVHPCYVDIIKQMNSLDAKLFKILVEKQTIPVINPKLRSPVNNDICASGIFPQYYLGVDSIDDCDVFHISASLSRLERLGVIEISFISWLSDEKKYGALSLSPIIQSIKNEAISTDPELKDFDLGFVNKGMIIFNDFCKAFVRVCL